MKKLILLAMLCSLYSFAASPKPNSGLDMEGFDTSVRPQDDFFRYVNGKWLDETEIPPEYPRYGVFIKLRDESQKHSREIVEATAAIKDPKMGTPEQRVGDFYRAFLNVDRVNELGLKPLDKEIKKIEKAKSHDDLIALFAHLNKHGGTVPFGSFVGQDGKDATQYILYMFQSGLGLPNRDYYFKDDERSEELRNLYKAYMGKMLTLAGYKDVDAKVATIYEIEKRLATDQWTPVDNRNRDKTYNKRSFAEFQKETPGFDWAAYFKALGYKKPETLIVNQPSYQQAFAKAFKEIPVSDWKLYAKWHLLNDAAPYLSEDFDQAAFEFFGKELTGVQEQRPRWKRALSSIDQVMGEEVGQIYVKKHFTPEAKARMVELVDNLMATFDERIDTLNWMSPETKKNAKAKLEVFKTKIGYPDKWRDYSALKISPDNLIQNMQNAAVFQFEDNMGKLGKPINRDEWFMAPQIVNAYHYPPMNEIVFPAAILRPPFFDLEADDAVNYGAIGGVIGHEITHGFDDQGRKYNPDGNLEDWWTSDDNEKFSKLAKQLVEQYNGYEPVDGVNINGELTLGENIADLGGLTMAYHAYKRSLKGKPSPVIDGFTGEQRVFLGWTQAWRAKATEQYLRQQVLTDPHSPPKYRVMGVLPNMPEFYEAFDVKPGDGMYKEPAERVSIW